MITIKELVPPIKLSGLSSLLVSFPYNQEIITYLKSLDLAVYHKKLTAWELPIYYLAQLLDNLVYYDDIKLEFVSQIDLSGQESTDKSINYLQKVEKSPECPPESQKAEKDHCYPVTSEEIANFKFKPFKHQIEAINYCVEKGHKKWLLLDEMGSGKTATMIWLAETLKNRGLIDHCLIICGVNSIKQNWKKSINKFSKESCIVLGEKISKSGKISYKSLAERAEILKNPIEEFFVITNIEALRSDVVIESISKSKNKFGLICVDEIHKSNNCSSSQGHNIMKLDSDYKVGATGTLLTASPVSLYLPLAWTDNDYATLTNFKKQYCQFGGFNNSQIVGYQHLDVLKEELDSCSLRRTKDQFADLPPKTITVEYVEMSDEHRKFYEAIKAGVKEEADKVKLTPGNLLALTTRLRQATADPGILTTQDIESTKLERCVELAEELADQGEKVVIISQFIPPAYKIAKKLERFHPSINTSDQDETTFFGNVERFLNDPNELIFVGTASKCATGIDLNSAAYMIMLDEFWGSYMNDQCTDRIYRMNNTRPAFVTVLACVDSIDERVHQVSEMKKDLGDYIIDGKENVISQQLSDEMLSVIRDL